MEEIRKHHNDAKRALIQSVTKEGYHILDVGSGFGGDLMKWKNCGAYINMCEPRQESLDECKSRAKNMKIRANFYLGDITKCPKRQFDVICYNFSLHYIFESKKLFDISMREIKNRMKPGGMFIGIIPDSEKIIFKTPLEDELGNYFIMDENSGYGNYGEKLKVKLVDTPYYANGEVPEPIGYRDILITRMMEMGFTLVSWEGLEGSKISELYSKFIFVYKR